MRYWLHPITLGAVLLVGCATGADVDAQKAISSGDNRLVGYMGIGLVVPGTPTGFDVYAYRPGVRVLPGVTDTSSGFEIRRADSYARDYNRIVLNQK